ncbi:MAG: methyltransferase domain-containing protein [Pseudomonadota bacterium]
MDKASPPESTGGKLDTSTDDRFFEYYEAQSQSEETLGRFERLADLVLKTLARDGREGPFDVVDIGGGAGTGGRIFARTGHRVTCIDISADLLAVGEHRAREEKLDMQFINCSATGTPLPDACVDICILPELLEHVAEWQACLDEASRLLRPGGLLFLSTTNTLCPLQDEFNLPLYSWYPGFVKRHYERLAVTTRPEVANYAKYPAVNWFTFYSLRGALRKRGFSRFLDRLDMIEVRTAGTSKGTVARWLRYVPLSRLAFQLVTPNSIVLALKPAT